MHFICTLFKGTHIMDWIIWIALWYAAMAVVMGAFFRAPGVLVNDDGSPVRDHWGVSLLVAICWLPFLLVVTWNTYGRSKL